MNDECIVLRSDQEYNVNVVKTSVKCSEPRPRQTLFLVLIFLLYINTRM